MAARASFSIPQPQQRVAEHGAALDPIGPAVRPRRQAWLIPLVVALFLGAALAYTATTDKIYQATTRVLLDPRDRQPVAGIVPPNPGGDRAWVETQLDLVSASATLSHVIESEGLLDDPEYAGGDGARLDTVLAAFARQVRADRAADSYVIDVSVASRSAEKAARLSNAAADAFLAGQAEAKREAVRQASLLVARQIDELRAWTGEAEARVEAHRREQGGGQLDGLSIDEQSLRQLNEANVAARLRVDEASSRLARIDAIVRSGNGDLATTLSTVDSPVLSRLKLDQAQALRRQAELAETLGPRHPRLQAAEAELVRGRGLIRQELESLAARARVEAELAKSQVASSAAALAVAARRLNDTDAASVALRALEGEASFRRGVYRAFVARIREQGPQDGVPPSHARIINPAPVPQEPSWPRKAEILWLAGLAGLGVGIALALNRGRSRPSGATPARGEPIDTPPAAMPASVATPDEPAVAAVVPAAAPDILAEIVVPGSLTSGDPLSEAVAGERIAAAAREGEADFRALAARLTRLDATEGPAVHILFGTAASGAIAAIAYGLARVMAERSAETLLIDANTGTVTTAMALIGSEATGILDVALGDEAPEGIGARLDDASIVLLPAASVHRRHEIGDHGDRLVETIEDVADSFERIIIDLGASCPPALFNALVAIADDAVLVVDAAEAGSPSITALYADLRDLLPELRGMVSVRARSSIVAPPGALG